MKAYNSLLLMVLILLSLFSQACASTTSANEPAIDAPGGAAQRIVMYNWADYIDPEFYPMFKAETGIEVVEDNFASFEEMLAKLQGGATGYTLIVADSRTVSVLKTQGKLARLDHHNIPNLANLYERFRTLPFDPGNEYCATYQWGMTGLGYNADEVAPPASWSALFEPDPNAPYYGRMTMLDDVREAFAAALIYLGYDINTTDETQLKEAQQALIKARAGLAGYDSVTYYSLIGAGENLLAHSWNGDMLRAMDQNPDGAKLSFVIPQEGGVAWVDSLCIPSSATPEQKLAAELFINFLLRPDIGARLSERNFFASPNEAAEAFLAERFLNDPIVYPPAEVADKLQYLMPLGQAEVTYQRLWDEVKAYSD
jgi:spermidine/putrescine transport system substrate-binding protein